MKINFSKPARTAFDALMSQPIPPALELSASAVRRPMCLGDLYDVISDELFDAWLKIWQSP